MLNDAVVSGFNHVYICTGRSDLRKGISGLSTMIKEKFGLDPFQTGDLFLFCGSSSNKIKGLIWEGDGFLLIYKRLEAGTFKWPRNQEEARALTQEQFQNLMNGFSIDPPVKKIRPSKTI